MTHVYPADMLLCACCGRSKYESFSRPGGMECDGVPGIVHENYVKARREFNRFMGPILEGFGVRRGDE